MSKQNEDLKKATDRVNLYDDMSDDELEAIYTWVDEVPLKRPKKNIQRDFADGSLLAHIIQHYLPKNQKALI